MTAGEARDVRPGQEIDAAALGTWCATHGLPATVTVRQYHGGFSNLTYLIEAGARVFVLRRPPPGVAIRGGHDVLREYALLERLVGAFPVPAPVAACDDAAVIGTPFYLMERVDGIVPRTTDAHALTPALLHAASASLADALAALHALPAARFASIGKPEGYVRRQVEGWAARYDAAKTDALPALERAFAWLLERMPPDGAAALVHNDFKLDNVVVDASGAIRAVLDWEMATVGDPLLDLGTALAYWVDPGEALAPYTFVPTTLPGAPNRRAFAERYVRARGSEPGDLVYAYVFGLCKIAVIAQQLYARALRGATSDARMGALGRVVAAFGDAAAGAIAKETL